MYQNCLEQSQKHVCNGAYDHCNYMEIRLKTIDYNAGEGCDVVIKVFTCVKIAQDRVGNMFAMVLTIITTIRRPGFRCGLCWISTNSRLENFFSQESHFNIVTVFQLFYTSSLITVS